MIDLNYTDFLLSVIAVMSTAQVAAASFFIKKVWEHNARIGTIEALCGERHGRRRDDEPASVTNNA